MIEMEIDSVRILGNGQRAIFLREKNEGRYLLIYIGPHEANSIVLKLQNVETPRPMTHDLLSAIITDLGAAVDHIAVNDLKDDFFYSKIVLRHNDSLVEIDSRPSDALALAVRTQATIYVEESIIEENGLKLDEETGEFFLASDQPKGGQRSISEEELEGLSAFKDFVGDLDMEGLGEGKEPPKEVP